MEQSLLESLAAASYNFNMGKEPSSLAETQDVPSDGPVKQDRGARIFAVIAIFLFAVYFIGALTTHS